MKCWVVFLCALLVPVAGATSQSKRKWVVRYTESFEKTSIPEATWRPNDLLRVADGNDPFADDGEYFTKKDPNFQLPDAYRAAVDFGQENWLRIETYSRNSDTEFKKLFSIVDDPGGKQGKVLKITSPRHTDGTVLRSRLPLPKEYRICAKVGYADFGSGKEGNNGYEGGERAEPWVNASSLSENGFYWLAILSKPPRPRNNVWIHHHRKAVIDSDNNWYPKSQGGAWSKIWDGRHFKQSGEHPVMVFVLDNGNRNLKRDYNRVGQPFISVAAGHWNSEAKDHEIHAADAYKDNTWYQACIQKAEGKYTLQVEGDFKYGGKTRYDGAIALAKVLDANLPDYFMMGDPHVNFYRGTVYYDDLRMEVLQ